MNPGLAFAKQNIAGAKNVISKWYMLRGKKRSNYVVVREEEERGATT